jgi:uncharacterized membrane protein
MEAELMAERADAEITMTDAFASVYPWLLVGLLILAFAIVVGGLFNRYKTGKGLGWQFIRFTVLGITLPLVTILALTDKFGAETAGIFGAAIGYLFGKDAGDDS